MIYEVLHNPQPLLFPFLHAFIHSANIYLVFAVYWACVIAEDTAVTKVESTCSQGVLPSLILIHVQWPCASAGCGKHALITRPLHLLFFLLGNARLSDNRTACSLNSFSSLYLNIISAEFII